MKTAFSDMTLIQATIGHNTLNMTDLSAVGNAKHVTITATLDHDTNELEINAGSSMDYNGANMEVFNSQSVNLNDYSLNAVESIKINDDGVFAKATTYNGGTGLAELGVQIRECAV